MPVRELTTKRFQIFCFSLDFQFTCTITQLLDSDWPANILAKLNFRAQESQLMSPDGVCAISVGLAGHETILDIGFVTILITRL